MTTSKLVQAIDRFGQQFMVYDQDLIGMTILGGEFWDGPLLLPFYDRFSHPEKTAIEIGAFFGQGAVYLAKKNKTVIAVEPIYADNILQALPLNNVSNVSVLTLAAYSHTCVMKPAPDEDQGQAVLNKHREEIGNLGGLALIRDREYELERPLPAHAIMGARLDSMLNPNAPISLIKVDAQGCDLRALMGLTETISRWRPPILFEWEENLAALHNDTWTTVIEFFMSLPGTYRLISQGPRGYANCWVAVPEGVEYPDA